MRRYVPLLLHRRCAEDRYGRARMGCEGTGEGRQTRYGTAGKVSGGCRCVWLGHRGSMCCPRVHKATLRNLKGKTEENEFLLPLCLLLLHHCRRVTTRGGSLGKVDDNRENGLASCRRLCIDFSNQLLLFSLWYTDHFNWHKTSAHSLQYGIRPE